MPGRRVAIIGAGPGGLTTAMLLAAQGFDVDVFEKADRVGGRNARLAFDGYTFDLGPTFVMMKYILEEVFELAGRRVDDYLDLRRIDPLYRLRLPDGSEFFPSTDPAKMKLELDRVFPGSYPRYRAYMEYQKKKFDRIMPCLQVPYQERRHMLRLRFLRALPYLDAGVSLMSHLKKWFKPQPMRLAFTFQAKYLGMSPWVCPGIFSMISYVEHTGGIYHPIGGLFRISEAMAEIGRELGVKLHLDTPVSQIMVKDGRAVGVRLESKEAVHADYVVLNADFGYAMRELVPSRHLRRWTPETLRKKTYSCSGFLLYLGLDRRYEQLAHHNMLFAPDYRQNMREIGELYTLSEDPTVYVQNACVTDGTLAPEGKSTLYAFVPVVNSVGEVDWEREAPRYRDKVVRIIEERGGFEGLSEHIVAERVITPLDFEQHMNVYRGAIFSLAHTVDQMLYFRPHNRNEDIRNLFVVGGNTHPGSGLPTIYESARISAAEILRDSAWFVE